MKKPPLAVTHPELAKQAVSWSPEEVTHGSDKRLMWRCSNGHEWLASPNSRTSKGVTGCPVCSGNKLLVGFNDLASTDPEVATQAFGWDPKTVSRGSRKKVKWKCNKGHVWESVVANRTSLGNGCPICSGQKVLVGFNDLATTDPEIANQADGWNPREYSRGSSKRLKWKCDKGHSWSAPPRNRTINQSGCSVCSNQTIQVGVNDLKTTHSEIAQELLDLDGLSFTAGSHRIVQWKCNLGHIYKTSPQKRTYRGNSCPYCSGHKVLAGFNDLASTHPNLIEQVSGWDATKFTSGSIRKQEWICSLGHKWKATIYSRVAGNNCPICSNHQVLAGYNDLRTTHPQLADEADGWDPTKITYGSKKKLKWKCKDEHKWQSVVSSRATGIGCPSCAEYGFDPNEKGWLYFLEHPDWEMYQIGITNVPDQRLNKHRSLGWIVIEVRGSMDGHLARDWEKSILRMLKARGADLSNSDKAGKFDGYSESWSKATFHVKSLFALMENTREFESGSN